MKAPETTEATQLAEFLYKLEQAPFTWLCMGPAIRSSDADDNMICPISAVYGGHVVNAISGTYCPGLSKELRRKIVDAADWITGHDSYVREALMRAVHLPRT